MLSEGGEGCSPDFEGFESLWVLVRAWHRDRRGRATQWPKSLHLSEPLTQGLIRRLAGKLYGLFAEDDVFITEREAAKPLRLLLLPSGEDGVSKCRGHWLYAPHDGTSRQC